MKDDWTPIGDHMSYGHDIELSWLLTEAAEVYGDPGLLARARRQALAIAMVTRAQGVDTDGGVFDEGDPHGLTNMHKDWWPQAEAVIGFLNAYQIQGIRLTLRIRSTPGISSRPRCSIGSTATGMRA